MKLKKLLILSTILLFVSGCSSSEELRPIDRNVESDNSTQQETTTEVSSNDLASADGKDGNPCYVAVDGNVYEIKGSNFWVEGEHTTSSGRAKCGQDNSNTITSAPHGMSKLTSSKVTLIGKLAS